MLNQTHPVRTFATYFLNTLSNIIHPSTPRFSEWIFPSEFPTKLLHAFLTFPLRATFPVNLILLDLITLVTFGEAYRLRSSSLCSLFQHPATFSHLGPNILLSTFFSNSLNLPSPFRVKNLWNIFISSTCTGLNKMLIFVISFKNLGRKLHRLH